MASNDMDRVVPLGQLDDFQVAQGDPDVRGWEVMASDGRKIGEVDELLVDTAAMKVRYLDVDVDDAMAAGGPDRHVLIPIGYARLDRDHDRVMVDALASSDLRGVPSYDQGPLTRDFETSVRDSFSARREVEADGLSGGSGMMDTAGLDNTPGAGTRLGMTGAAGATGLTGGDVGMRMSGGGLGGDPDSVHAQGASAGTMASAEGGMGGGRTGAGGQGPAGGMEREDARMRGDAGRSPGAAGSDSMHGSGDDFYASDAFDDVRFYGARRSGPGLGGGGGSPTPRGQTGLGAGLGADQVDQLSGSGLSHTEPRLHGAGQEGVGADPEETRRLARDARELQREDQANRDVPGTGGF